MTESHIPSAGVQNIHASMIPSLQRQFPEVGTATTASHYHSYWELWCQGGSADAPMRTGGCRVIAIAKLLVESGLMDPEEDDPDSFLAWARQSSGHPAYFQADVTEWFRPDVNTGETLYTGASAVAWARAKGVTLVQHHISLSGSNSAADQALVLQKLREGYYVILDGDFHQAYVARSLSLEAGQVYLLDSFSDCSWSWWQFRPLIGYSLDGYTTLYYYELQ